MIPACADDVVLVTAAAGASGRSSTPGVVTGMTVLDYASIWAAALQALTCGTDSLSHKSVDSRQSSSINKCSTRGPNEAPLGGIWSAVSGSTVAMVGFD